MNLHEVVRSRRGVALVVSLAAASFCAGCRREGHALVVRMLLPPYRSSILREAVKTVQDSVLKTNDGRTIVLATMETKDTAQYHAFLQDIQTYRPQIVVVLRREEIPKVLQGQETYPTEPCSDVPNPCIALVGPWDTIEERNAAALVLGRTGPSGSAGR